MTTELTPGTTAVGSVQVAPGTTADGSALTESHEERVKKLEAEKQQWLGEKSKYEEARQQNEVLVRQIEALSSQPPTSGSDQVTLNVQAEYQELLMRAYAGDTKAQFQLSMLQGQQNQMAQVRRDAQLSVLATDERSEVETLLQKSPGLDIALARERVQAERDRKRLRDYEAREAEAKRIAEEQTRAGTAGVTSVRPAPASEMQTGTIKASELNARMAALKAKADSGDRQARAEALKLGRQIDSGEVKLILNE